MTRACFAIFAAALTTVSCAKPPSYEATVSLTIDGKQYSYRTKAAQVEVRPDPGVYSVYIKPNDAASAATPHVSLRTFSGTPVSRFSVRYLPAGLEKPLRFECFVPSTLSDGRDTLAWKKADGTKRDRTETGEASCKAKVIREGGALRFTFDATPEPSSARRQKKGAKADKQDAETIRVKGSARVML